MISQNELLEFFEDSAETYRFLSQVFFKELTTEAIDELAQGDYPEETGNECLDKGYRLIRRYFSFSATDRRTQLACEYARIFLAAGVFTKDAATAVPYESVFTSEDRIMMQGSRDDVVVRYLEDGFKVDPSLHEPEDHLAFELEYLSSMNARAAELAEAKDSAGLERNVVRQIEFIDGHLLNWIPLLRETAQEYAKLAFYIGMLLVAQGSLEQGREMLEDVLKQMRDGASDEEQAE